MAEKRQLAVPGGSFRSSISVDLPGPSAIALCPCLESTAKRPEKRRKRNDVPHVGGNCLHVMVLNHFACSPRGTPVRGNPSSKRGVPRVQTMACECMSRPSGFAWGRKTWKPWPPFSRASPHAVSSRSRGPERCTLPPFFHTLTCS